MAGLRWWVKLNPDELSDDVSLMALTAHVSLSATEPSSLTPLRLLLGEPALSSDDAGAACESVSRVSGSEGCDWWIRDAADGISF